MRSRSRKLHRLACLALAAGLLLSPAALAEEKAPAKGQAKPAAAAPASEQDMMAEYMKYAAPGPEHDLLKSLAGTWKTVTKAWMGPGDPQVSEGKCVTTVILGGRYITDDLQGTFMNQPYEGFGVTGFDRLKKEYVSTWSDTMGTAIMMSRGTLDASGKVMTMTGIYDDPVSKQKQTMKMTTRFLDPNKHVFEIWEKHEGKEVKTMEITYTRE